MNKSFSLACVIVLLSGCRESTERHAIPESAKASPPAQLNAAPDNPTPAGQTAQAQNTAQQNQGNAKGTAELANLEKSAAKDQVGQLEEGKSKTIAPLTEIPDAASTEKANPDSQNSSTAQTKITITKSNESREPVKIEKFPETRSYEIDLKKVPMEPETSLKTRLKKEAIKKSGKKALKDGFSKLAGHQLVSHNCNEKKKKCKGTVRVTWAQGE